MTRQSLPTLILEEFEHEPLLFRPRQFRRQF